MLEDLKVLLEAVRGEADKRRMHCELRQNPIRLTDAIDRLQTAAGAPTTNGDAPVFIMSAGWRSGSTFLQRLIMADRDRLMWGEPYHSSRIIQSLSSQLIPFGNPGWPPEEFMIDHFAQDDLSSQWVANLYPDLQMLRQAHVAYLDQLFVQPARQRGFAAWGLKEVRLNTGHAAYLKWLYPDARFLFLVRDPVCAWNSYRKFRSWYFAWPDQIVLTPRAFGKIWAALAEDFRLNHRRVDGLLLRYEDLKSPATMARLQEYLGSEVAVPSSLQKVRGSAKGSDWIPKIERLILARTVRGVAAGFGY